MTTKHGCSLTVIRWVSVMDDQSRFPAVKLFAEHEGIVLDDEFGYAVAASTFDTQSYPAVIKYLAWKADRENAELDGDFVREALRQL
jgi:hypothetical protein